MIHREVVLSQTGVDSRDRHIGGVPVLRHLLEFVEVQLVGKPIPNVIPLNRDYVRSGDTAWVMKDGRLRIRKLQIVMRDAEHAFVCDGLDDGDLVVTTNLSRVSEGSRLRVEADDDSDSVDAGG